MKREGADATGRFAKLAGMGERVFHIADLASVWGISDRNTLYTTVKRYTRKGLLRRVQNGLYAIPSANPTNPFFMGIKAVHAYAYISAETILFREGVLSQKPVAIMLVGVVSKRFSIDGQAYRCRKMRDEFLYQPNGIESRGNLREASVTRAIADMLYYNPRAHFDAPIDWKKVRRMQRLVGFPETPQRYGEGAKNKK